MRKVAIYGVGLIGGSLGMGLVARGLARQVTGIGRNEANLRTAVELGAITDYTTDPVRGVAGAELVVLALPVRLIIGALRTVAEDLAPGTVVTDVGSTKTEIVREAEALLPAGVHFIGGHPMTGSEQAGVQAADRYLFEGAYYILTPTANTHSRAQSMMADLVESLGARMIEFDPAEHDRIMAAVSHFPHLVASALMNTVSGLGQTDRIFPLAAGGFRDTTRIASGNPEVWRDIFSTNRRPLLDMVTRFRAELEIIEGILAREDGLRLVDWLEQARQARELLPLKAKGYMQDLYQMNVTISDRPGSIAALANTLYRYDVNISDIEVLRVREGEGGTVRLAFGSEAERDLAARLLSADGIPVKKC
ncbi:MAG: prephenate dehydrogenase [Eubacteriales bacterium]|jgi:prephenate dehydrogenase|nr:prephenate dehydrogenase [Clostridia bacterium]MDZ4042125.1 prephenate dehydrogenase [Eubacteriales bacterium]MDZ7609799.1 prephenate dehydrogenase [Eubacteriales bacterium]